MTHHRLRFSLPLAREMFSKSRYYIVANIMVMFFTQTDRVMLKLMVDDSSLGFYSAALTCAGCTSFIILAIIDSVRPMIFQNRKISCQKFEQNMI